MMSPAELLLGVGVLAGLGLCLLGSYSYRRWDEPGIAWFAAFVAVLGIGAVVSGLVGLFFPSILESGEPTLPIWGQIAMLFWALSAVPWFLFALQYTGRYTRTQWRTVGLLFTPFLGIVANLLLEYVGVGEAVVMSLVGTIVFVYSLALAIVGGYLILRTTHRYGHLSLTHGAMLVSPTVVVFLLLNSMGVVYENDLAMSALFALAFCLVPVGLGVVLVRYEILDSAPAVGTIGEQIIARATDDLVFVVDDCGLVIKLNETAAETFGVSQADVLGAPLSCLLDHQVDELRERETVALETADGTRRYDVQTPSITDQHDRELGFLVTLHDVTEHELREQRLAVLNRVLRHNLRNKVEVVKSHAEVLEERHENGHAATIAETADAIADLGHSARTIDQFVSCSDASAEVDLVATVETALDSVPTDRDDVAVSLDLPESATVETNQDALQGALDSTLDNALTYAESAVDLTVEHRSGEYAVSVADDGPGIPDGELDCLDAGTETALEHGTGMGLWQLKWAVTTMGGDLSFDTSDGTTITFTVPDQGCADAAPTVADGRQERSAGRPDGPPDGAESTAPDGSTNS